MNRDYTVLRRFGDPEPQPTRSRVITIQMVVEEHDDPCLGDVLYSARQNGTAAVIGDDIVAEDYATAAAILRERGLMGDYE